MTCRFALIRRLGVLALVIGIVALPVDQLLPYFLLLVATVLAFTGQVSARASAWLAALAVSAIAIGGQMWLAPPPIVEGHNVFLPDAPDGALARGLPADVHRFMQARFDARYPPQRRCGVDSVGCWRNNGFPDRVFAFSGDSLLDPVADASRRVGAIDFSDPTWLRLGFVNDLRYNWYSGVSDVGRDRRFWMGLRRWHLTMPWFVMYRIPAAYAGAALCWRGDVLWEGDGGRFAAVAHAGTACRTLVADDAGRRIFGVGIEPESLAMTLSPPWSVRLRQIAGGGLMLAAFAGVLGLLVRVRPRAAALAFMLIGAALVVIAAIDASFVGGWRPFDGGDDGLFYEGVARNMVQYLVAGDVRHALEGGEKAFYYGGPGLRYLRALELFVFGDTSLGYLSLVLFLPILVLAIYRRFLPARWALALVLVFVLVPFGALLGSSYLHYAGLASRGFADSAAYISCLSGLLLLVGLTPAGPDARFAPAFGAALALALGVLIKPVVIPFVAVLLAGAGLAAVCRQHWARVAGLCLGFLPVTLMPLHNWVYGGVLVLTSTNAANAELLVMPPSAWAAAGAELLTLHLGGDHVRRAAVQLAGWLTGPSESPAMVPLHAAAIVPLVWVALRGRGHDRWLRLIAAATLAQHAVALFYAPSPRYYYMTWFVTLLVCAVWFRSTGLDLLRGRWPGACAAVARHPASRRLAGMLAALQKRTRLVDYSSQPASGRPPG